MLAVQIGAKWALIGNNYVRACTVVLHDHFVLVYSAGVQLLEVL